MDRYYFSSVGIFISESVLKTFLPAAIMNPPSLVNSMDVAFQPPRSTIFE